MNHTRRSAWYLATVLALLANGVCWGAPGEELSKTNFVYRGFHIDFREIQNTNTLAATRAALREQIDGVFTVGVTANILGFFQKVPFKAIRETAGQAASPALYNETNQTIETTAAILTAGHQPVLLHELLKAYHQQRYEGGFTNAEIQTFYERAKTIKAYATNSVILADAKEYFAGCATTYLFGVSDQEPFQREKLLKHQPVFYARLELLFGSNAGQYLGTLEHR